MRKFTFRTAVAGLTLIAASALTPAVANADTQPLMPRPVGIVVDPRFLPISPAPLWGIELGKKLAD